MSKSSYSGRSQGRRRTGLLRRGVSVDWARLFPQETELSPDEWPAQWQPWPRGGSVIYRVGTEKFVTGSEYTGGWDNCGMEGSGVYTMPHGVVYKGAIHDGEFHGPGRLIYPSGGQVEGEWVSGQMRWQRFVFSDGLTFEQPAEDWPYCRMPDRRFFVETREGHRPAGRSRLTQIEPTRAIPPGCYDTGDGFYNPRTKCVTCPESGKILRIPKLSEEKWIVANCRKGWDQNVGFRPDLYENWFKNTDAQTESVLSLRERLSLEVTFKSSLDVMSWGVGSSHADWGSSSSAGLSSSGGGSGSVPEENEGGYNWSQMEGYPEDQIEEGNEQTGDVEIQHDQEGKEIPKETNENKGEDNDKIVGPGNSPLALSQKPERRMEQIKETTEEHAEESEKTEDVEGNTEEGKQQTEEAKKENEKQLTKEEKKQNMNKENSEVEETIIGPKLSPLTLSEKPERRTDPVKEDVEGHTKDAKEKNNGVQKPLEQEEKEPSEKPLTEDGNKEEEDRHKETVESNETVVKPKLSPLALGEKPERHINESEDGLGGQTEKPEKQNEDMQKEHEQEEKEHSEKQLVKEEEVDERTEMNKDNAVSNERNVEPKLSPLTLGEKPGKPTEHDEGMGSPEGHNAVGVKDQKESEEVN